MKGLNFPTILLVGGLLSPALASAERNQGKCEKIISGAIHPDPVVRQCVVDFLQKNPEYCQEANIYLLMRNVTLIRIGKYSFQYSAILNPDGINTTSCTITIIAKKEKHPRGPANIQIPDFVP